MLSPRPSRFSHATLKSWEWPGDEARSTPDIFGWVATVVHLGVASYSIAKNSYYLLVGGRPSGNRTVHDFDLDNRLYDTSVTNVTFVLFLLSCPLVLIKQTRVNTTSNIFLPRYSATQQESRFWVWCTFCSEYWLILHVQNCNLIFSCVKDGTMYVWNYGL